MSTVHLQPVDSLDLPQLAPYRSMRWQEEHRRQGIFVAEGEKVVRRLLESDLEVVSLLLPRKWADAYASLLAARPEARIEVYTAEKKLLEQMTGFSMYQGVLAVAKTPRSISLQEAMKTCPKPLLFVAVDGLTNAENLGGLVRACAAFGAQAIIVGETCCSPYLRRAVRASVGTIFKIPVIETESLARTILEARTNGIRAIAAHPHAAETLLGEADLKSDAIIALGSEGLGLSAAVLRACDQGVAIRMENEVDSLNVGMAGAVFLYEASRQRGRQA